MSNVVIPYENIVNLISSQFNSIKPEGIEIIVEDEQMWNKEQYRNSNAIYIVVHFTESAINFGVAVVNISLEALSLQDEVEKTKEILNEFVNQFNRKESNNITQLYLSPTDSLNFNEIHEGFRSLFVISGTLLISNNVVSLTTLTYYYDGGSETIDVISYNDSTENSLNPQPLPSEKGRTKSYGSFQTFSFSIITYPDGNKQLIKDIYNMKFDDTRSHQNDTFEFSGTFSNGVINMPRWKFKCRDASFTQRIGEMPILTLAFTK